MTKEEGREKDEKQHHSETWLYWFYKKPNWVNVNPVVLLVQAVIIHLTSCSNFSSAHRPQCQRWPTDGNWPWCLVYLQPNLLVHGNRPVAEGDGIAEAGLPLNGPLGQIHDDLRALRAGVEEQGNGGLTPTWLHGQAALGFVVAAVGRGRAIQSVCKGKRRNISHYLTIYEIKNSRRQPKTPTGGFCHNSFPLTYLRSSCNICFGKNASQ